MEKSTKYDTLKEFLADLTVLFYKIQEGLESQQDYTVLQEYLELSNVPPTIIEDCYLEGGFNNWIEFYEAKKRSKRDPNQNVNISLSKIRGVVSAVTANLSNYLKNLEAENQAETE